MSGSNCSVAPGLSLKHVGEKHTLFQPSCVTGPAAEEGAAMPAVMPELPAQSVTLLLGVTTRQTVIKRLAWSPSRKEIKCSGHKGQGKCECKVKDTVLKHTPQFHQHF